MKKIHKTRWMLLGLVAVIVFPSICNSLIVVAETMNSSEVESADVKSIDSSTSEQEAELKSNAYESTMKESEITPDSIEDMSAADDKELGSEESEITLSSGETETRHSFPPPAVGNVGDLLLHNASSEDEARNLMKNNFLPQLLSTKAVVSGKLGASVGDSIEIEIGNMLNVHFWFLLFGRVGGESWYGNVTLQNLQVQASSNAISTQIEKKPNGSHVITVKRVRAEKETQYKLNLNYDYNFAYYKSNMVDMKWYQWVDAGTETIKSVESNVSVEAEPVEETLTADPVPQNMVLGEPFKYGGGELRDLVKNVRFAGKELSAKDAEYEVKYLDKADTSTVGDKVSIVEVIYSKDKSKTVQVEIPTNINWGNSIHFKSAKQKSILALSGVASQSESSKGVLYTTKGLVESGDVVNPEAPNEEYVSAELYSKEIYSFPSDKVQDSLSVKGSDEISNIYDSFNHFSWVDGQVLKVYHKDILNNSELLELYTGSKKEMPNINNNMIRPELYFLLDYGKMRPLYINQLYVDTDKLEIPINSNKEYMDNHIEKYINKRNYQNIEIKFSQYPDTTKLGKQKGKIKAIQNKVPYESKISYEYEIEFDVVDNRKLTAEAVAQEMVLGSSWDSVDPYKLVEKVKFGDTELDKSEFTVELIDKPTPNTVGDKTAKVLITYKKDTSKTLTLDVPVQVLWGNTIGSNNVIYSNSTGFSLSLLTEDKPNIISTLGNGKNSGNWINDYRNGTYITTKVFKDSQLLNSEDANPYINLAISGRDSAKNANNKWNGLSNRNQISYGDVLQYDVLSQWGDNKWIMRDEVQKFESLGKQSIYYEITKSGYRTLHLNHLETKNVTIPIYSTEEYLDKNIKDYIDLKGYSNISVKEFSQYPNTKASGQQKGKVIVEETLSTGKKVQYEYEVTFTVGDGTLEYGVPKSLLNPKVNRLFNECILEI